MTTQSPAPYLVKRSFRYGPLRSRKLHKENVKIWLYLQVTAHIGTHPLPVFADLHIDATVEMWTERGDPDGPGYDWRLIEANVITYADGDAHGGGQSGVRIPVAADSDLFVQIAADERLADKIAILAGR